MSLIEWTDTTWNPVTGCTKVSDGCKHCYAERDFPRVYPGRRFTDIRFHEDRLFKPLHWKFPRRVFVNSMSDLFHEKVSDGQLVRILHVMYRAWQHQFQILTKRPKRMLDFMLRWCDLEGEEPEPKLVQGPAAVRATHPSGRGQLFASMLDSMGEPPAGAAFPFFDWMEGSRWWTPVPGNVWLGVSVEDQRTADARIETLRQTPAAVRFVSVEPLIAPVSLLPAFLDGGIDWVIVGGESGPRARPCRLEWVRRVIDDCRQAKVPVFVKQLGRYPRADSTLTPPGPRLDQIAVCEMQDRKGGKMKEWPPDLRVREYPPAQGVGQFHD